MENGRYYRAVRRAKAIQLLDWPRVLSPLTVKEGSEPVGIRQDGERDLGCFFFL